MRYLFTGVLLSLTACAGPTDEAKWFQAQVRRCYAMGSSSAYDPKIHVFECFRTPFARMPKLVFRAVYLSPPPQTP